MVMQVKTKLATKDVSISSTAQSNQWHADCIPFTRKKNTQPRDFYEPSRNAAGKLP